MPEIRLKIKGVHYAVHPDYNPRRGDVSTEEMELETIERLRELDERRPKVILVPEPFNPVDPKAVRAWCEGNPIGRVDADQTSEAHCLFNDSCRMAVVQIDSVEVQQRGNFFVKAELSDEALSRKSSIFDTKDNWKGWRCDIPKSPVPEAWESCRVLEFMMEDIFSNLLDTPLQELTDYMDKWIDRSLHDFSEEAMQTRTDYINRLRDSGNERLEPLAKRLEKQITAICGDHRMVYRMDWWKKLQHSPLMENYWDKWRSGQGEDNLRKDLYKVDTCLRRMPDDLYSFIGNLSELFSALRYRSVPRDILWNIYTLLLLRQRICRELGIAMKPLPINAYGVEPEDTIGEEDRMDETSDECGSEVKVSGKPRSKGRTPESLFKNKDGERDDALTQEWAALFVEYLTHHKAMNKEIDTRKDNYASRTFVVFYQKWVKNGLVSSLPNGNACFQFLQDDCGLTLKVGKCTYGNHIRKMITGAKDLDLLDIESNVNAFLKSHKN